MDLADLGAPSAPRRRWDRVGIREGLVGRRVAAVVDSAVGAGVAVEAGRTAVEAGEDGIDNFSLNL